MTHAISPISFKLLQFIQESKVVRAPGSPWGITAPTANTWGKRLKLARKMHFQRISLTLTVCDGS